MACSPHALSTARPHAHCRTFAPQRFSPTEQARTCFNKRGDYLVSEQCNSCQHHDLRRLRCKPRTPPSKHGPPLTASAFFVCCVCLNGNAAVRPAELRGTFWTARSFKENRSHLPNCTCVSLVSFERLAGALSDHGVVLSLCFTPPRTGKQVRVQHRCHGRQAF